MFPRQDHYLHHLPMFPRQDHCLHHLPLLLLVLPLLLLFLLLVGFILIAFELALICGFAVTSSSDSTSQPIRIAPTTEHGVKVGVASTCSNFVLFFQLSLLKYTRHPLF